MIEAVLGFGFGVITSWWFIFAMFVLCMWANFEEAHMSRDEDLSIMTTIYLILIVCSLHFITGLSWTFSWVGVLVYFIIGTVLAIQRYIGYCDRVINYPVSKYDEEDNIKRSIKERCAIANNKNRLYNYIISWPFSLLRNITSIIRSAFTSLFKLIFSGYIQKQVDEMIDSRFEKK